MSAPVLWIGVPVVVAGLTSLLFSERAAAILGGATCLLLALLALTIPIDQALLLGPISVKIGSTASFLGRSLILPPTESPLLSIVFGIGSLWFFGAAAVGVASRLVPAGLAIMGLLVASIAVQPFLYAALLIETAVLVSVPMLSPMSGAPGRGVVRFLIYQTLGMPFILFSGWLLAGVEASPGNLSLTIQSTIMLALGFAFLLAIFPLNDWIPRLMEESHPFVAAFLLWLLPMIIVLFAMSFLDRYAWLRTSADVNVGLRALGFLMLLTGALWSAFERHLGRMMGHVTVASTGMLLLGLSLSTHGSTELVFAFLVPRGLAMGLWGFSLANFPADGGLGMPDANASGRTHPWAFAGVVVAALSAASFPLLGGFPPAYALWAGLAEVSSAAAAWYLVGLLGLGLCVARQVSILLGTGESIPWASKETILQRGLIGAGISMLCAIGIFPQALDFITTRLPLMFEHLGR